MGPPGFPAVSAANAAGWRQLVLLAVALLSSGCTNSGMGVATGESRYRVGRLLHRDDFRQGLGRWAVELEAGGTVRAADGALEIDVPRGATVWFRPELQGPVLIEYEATAVSQGGPNDRVSDLNSFWMATDPRSPGDLLERPRTGKFEDYEPLRMYYVGLGGNANTTSRFRRYAGAAGRPLLPEHDLRAPGALLQPNRPYRVRLVASGSLIQYWRDGEKLFEMNDPDPYRRGWFGVRTTQNRMRVRNLRIHRLVPQRCSTCATMGPGPRRAGPTPRPSTAP